MKHKFFLEKHLNEGSYTLQELGELDPGNYTVLCNEKYDSEVMDEALSNGKKSFFAVLRTNNMFPAEFLAGKLFEAALTLKDAKEDEKIEILFNDLESLPAKEVEPEAAPKEENAEEKEVVELEGLLDDDDDDEADKSPAPAADTPNEEAVKPAPDDKAK